jgi:alkylhydroperoxidase family enzyme
VRPSRPTTPRPVRTTRTTWHERRSRPCRYGPAKAERAAPALAEEGTRLADAREGVSDETWAQVREHYDDDQIAALVSLVAVINASNRFGVILHNQGGSYEPGLFAGMTS